MKKILIIFSVIFISCHSNPGYNVSIHIDKSAKANDNDIKLIKQCLNQKSYYKVLVKSKDSWKMESYNINLDKEISKNIKNKYIHFVVEYNYNKDIITGARIIGSVKVRIGNIKEGRKPALKKEIDKIADDVVKKIANRFDTNNFLVKRKFVTPM